MPKCRNRQYLNGAYFECQLEKGHVVGEALPDEEIESTHSASGVGVDEKGNKVPFQITWG